LFEICTWAWISHVQRNEYKCNIEWTFEVFEICENRVYWDVVTCNVAAHSGYGNMYMRMSVSGIIQYVSMQ
jgi:hypothetical protein